MFFVVASTALLGSSGVIPAIAIGFILMIMVYAGVAAALIYKLITHEK